MKLAISAALLSLAMTAPLVAQSAPDAPSLPPASSVHPGGPHGPHMFGPRMQALHVDPIANAPFTAQFTETSNMIGRDGQQHQQSSTSMVYRDSQGRVREEMTLPAPPARVPNASGEALQATVPPRGPRTIITILDPIAHTITHLNPERQTAHVQTVPADFFTRMQQRDDRRESGQGPQHSRDSNLTSTSLGAKAFAGVSATGTQVSGTLPARGDETPHTVTRQMWYSPDLKFEVSSSMTSDRGTHSNTLTSFNRAEPDPNLFQVPAGYTTTDGPERFGGHHRDGHGGPDADPGSAPAPTPGE